MFANKRWQSISSSRRRGTFFPQNIQAKLRVSQADDAHEREADSVARHIMRQTSDADATFFPAKSYDAGAQQMPIQRKAASAATVSGSPVAGLSGGSSFGKSERAFFESRMGQDFSDVRIHTDRSAQQSAAGINALAYTHGSSIVFGEGQYQPHTDAGKSLIAHELTHVVQQRGGAGADIQRQEADPKGEHDERKLIGKWLPSAKGYIRFLQSAIQHFGFFISGIAVGVRASGAIAEGLEAGAGSDALYFLDIANLEVSKDTLAYAELGVGLTAGVAGGVIIGIRISPMGQHGTMSGAYGGQSFSFSLKALAGIGLSISPGLIKGDEGFVSASFSLGAQAGISSSMSYAVSYYDTQDAIRGQAENAATAVQLGSRATQQAVEVAKDAQHVAASIFETGIATAKANLEGRFWKFNGLPLRAQLLLLTITAENNRTISPDAFVKFASQHIGSILSKAGLAELSADIQTALNLKGNGGPGHGFAGIFTPESISGMTLSGFVQMLNDAGLVQFRRSAADVARQMQENAENG